MLRSVAARALWLTKGAALFGGAAVTLALVLGVGTVALAAVPGDPFKLGQNNDIDVVTRLAGEAPGAAMLVVDNDSSVAGSRALDLRVEAGRAPMRVTAGSGKAPNLNADQVDGKGADEIGINGLEWVFDNSSVNSDSHKVAIAQCPDGKVLVGPGYELSGDKRGLTPDQQTDVVVTHFIPLEDSVIVEATEEEPTAATWHVVAHALCATEGTP